jgi:hypothetical protein
MTTDQIVIQVSEPRTPQCTPAAVDKLTQSQEKTADAAKLPFELIQQIVEALIPAKVSLSIKAWESGMNDWYGAAPSPYCPHIHCSDYDQFTWLLLISKDLNSKLGPLIYSRIELKVSELRFKRGNPINNYYRREDLEHEEDKDNLRYLWDTGMSSLHRTLVEKYSPRVWVDDAARARELGLFEVPPVDGDAEEVDIAEEVEVADDEWNAPEQSEWATEDADGNDGADWGVASMKLE